MATNKLIWTPEEDERLSSSPRYGLWSKMDSEMSFRTSEDYKDRFRELDMPLHEREWDLAEKTKFWRRWAEFQEDNSLPVFSGTGPASRQSDTFTESKTTLSESDPTTPPPSQEVTSSSSKTNM
ncbi:MAG: hypothetical protein J3Q66DRAFT_368598 [Benniella sp.]|nr:MAG: hypothetical protein J3Q66DRAFT_368598 [Benniella sp.]